eukprot:4192430-Amphidinium_carterae.1
MMLLRFHAARRSSRLTWMMSLCFHSSARKVRLMWMMLSRLRWMLLCHCEEECGLEQNHGVPWPARIGRPHTRCDLSSSA